MYRHSHANPTTTEMPQVDHKPPKTANRGILPVMRLISSSAKKTEIEGTVKEPGTFQEFREP
jgi:hypothetical protein